MTRTQIALAILNHPNMKNGKTIIRVTVKGQR